MPFTRSITIALVVVFVGLALFISPGHPYFREEALWYAAVLALLVFGMAATRDFFMHFVALLFVGYHLQRLIVLYFAPREFNYHDVFPSQDTVSSGLLFLIACAAATLAGWWLAQLRLGVVRPRRPRPSPATTDVIAGYRIPFERLFLWYAVAAAPLLLLQIGLLFSGIGATGIAFDRQYAVVYRMSFLLASTGFLPFFALARRGATQRTRIVAVVVIALQLFLAIALTSKGTLMILVTYMIVCWHFAGRRISPRLVSVALALTLLTAFVYYPLMATLRLVVVQVLTDPNGWRNLFSIIARVGTNVVVVPTALPLSWRLGGFDWLIALMTYGRENFPDWVSTKGDLIHILNSLVPGDLIVVPGYIPVEQLMPMYLRGMPTVESLSGHAELMGIAGMAYLYYGLAFGALFFLVWSFVSAKVLQSRLNPMIKTLYFVCFVVLVFTGGGFITATQRFYEGLIALALLIVFDIVVTNIVPAGARPRLRRARSHTPILGSSR